jgi:hypothetical protein
MDRELLEDLIKEEAVLPRVKVESLIMPYIGLRRFSQVTIPAELPGGAEMGQRIDEKVRPHMTRLTTISEPAAKLAAVKSLKEMLEKGFEEYVEGSP